MKVLFICIGNSCRSPMAESVLKSIVQKNNAKWIIDSAALATWNVGRTPEPRCLEVLEENGISSDHIGRQITKDDFYNFDYIFGMDEYNIEDLNALAPDDDCRKKIHLLGEFGNLKLKIIEDPYFEIGIHGFRRCFDQILPACTDFFNLHLNK